MTSQRSLATLAVLVLVLVLGAVALYAGRAQPIASVAAPNPTATATAPTATATATASPVSARTSAPSGTITGRLAYPSGVIPPLTIYAIRVDDPKVFFSVDFAGGGTLGATPPPSAFYTLTGVAPGSYHVIAYRNDRESSPGVYSRHTVSCVQVSDPNATPAPGCSANDHALVPVTVRAGETVTRIDMVSWDFQQPPAGTYPARPR